jgi:hypothetical protein
MSLDNCIHELTHKTDLGDVRRIVLIHGSDDNSDPGRFKREVAAATGKTVIVAQAGTTIEFNNKPF